MSGSILPESKPLLNEKEEGGSKEEVAKRLHVLWTLTARIRHKFNKWMRDCTPCLYTKPSPEDLCKLFPGDSPYSYCNYDCNRCRLEPYKGPVPTFTKICYVDGVTVRYDFYLGRIGVGNGDSVISQESATQAVTQGIIAGKDTHDWDIDYSRSSLPRRKY